MKRNRGGERDLDHIILAALRGVDRAELEYPQVRAGVILMMDRTFDARQNAIIVEKAIRYGARGVIGIDIAGPRPGGGARFDYAALAPLVQQARDAGLGVTVHCGEEGYVEEIAEVVEVLQPDRIGHGILAAGDRAPRRRLAETGIVLEICPTSNLLTGALSGPDEVREGLPRVPRRGRARHRSTDGPEMMRTHLRMSSRSSAAIGAMTAEEAHTANALAHEVSFVAPAARGRGLAPARLESARCRTSYSALRCTAATRNRAGVSSPSPVGRCPSSTRA